MYFQTNLPGSYNIVTQWSFQHSYQFLHLAFKIPYIIFNYIYVVFVLILIFIAIMFTALKLLFNML